MDIDGKMTIFDPVIKESLCVKERHEWNEGAKSWKLLEEEHYKWGNNVFKDLEMEINLAGLNNTKEYTERFREREGRCGQGKSKVHIKGS